LKDFEGLFQGLGTFVQRGLVTNEIESKIVLRVFVPVTLVTMLGQTRLNVVVKIGSQLDATFAAGPASVLSLGGRTRRMADGGMRTRLEQHAAAGG